ncbi:MAG: tol-pal system protein YbgF [Acidobacteriota bacterium]
MRALFLAATFTLVSGCQSGLTSRPEARPDETPRLRSELIEAKQRAVMAEVEAERLASKVADLERQLREARSLAQQAPPARDAEAVIDDVTLSSPRGVEEVELEELPPPAVETPAPPPTVETSTPGGESPQALYDRAYSLFHEKRYADAEAAFNQFLARHRSSHLADNAQFWIGESRWARGDFSSALAAFMATVEGFPHGNKVADALLKAGRCLEALGQKQRAGATYRELVTRFPSSAAALSAEQRLQEL